MKHKIREKAPEKVWAEFLESEKLSDKQLEQFQKYASLLSEWNRKFNLTAISGLSEIVSRHFCDSLALRNCVDLTKVKTIADVGSGAGFPGIPLKIMFPDLDVILIEVTRKKINFLRTVIDELELEDITVCDIDWRTFLRTTEGTVDYFCVRASLELPELFRAFKPGCTYKDAQIAYWAIKDWKPEEKHEGLVRKTCEYKIKRTERKLVFFGQ